MGGFEEKMVKIVYTPFGNLKKKKSMEIGQVGFKKRKKVQLFYFSYLNSVSLYQKYQKIKKF